MDSQNTGEAQTDMDSGLKKAAWNEMDSGKKLDLKQLLKPALIGMAIAGCYNFKDIFETREKYLVPVISFIYRSAIVLSLMLMIVKFSVAFFYLPIAYFIFNLLVVLWIAFLISTYLLNLKCTSARFGNYQKVFQFWDQKIMQEFEEMGIEYNVTKIKIGTIIVLIATCLNIVLNVTGCAVLSTGPTAYFFTVPLPNSAGTIALFLIMQFIASCTWMLPTAFVIIFSMVLQEAFDSLNEFATQNYTQNSCKMPPNFQKVRLLHLDLCKLVSDLDQDLGWYYALSFVFNMGVSVFSLYQVIRTSTDTVEQAVFIYWCVIALVIIGLTSVFAAFLHDSAHSPLDEIYNINVEDITVEKLAQLNLFLSKLTGTQVGFSTCGLIVITKEFILTIAGVFLTYFAILYTF